MNNLIDLARSARRGTTGLWIPMPAKRQPNVIAVHTDAEGNERIIRAKNLITTAGATWYAQKATGASPTNAFNVLTLGTGNGGAWAAASVYSNLTGPIAGSIVAVDGTYPKNADSDSSNTGAGPTVVSWRWSLTSAQFTSGTPITDAVITVASPTGSSPLLTGFTFASSFTLGAGESVKIFVNHSLTPV